MAKVLELQLQRQSFQWIFSWYPLGWTSWISLLSKGLSKESSLAPQFKSISSSAETFIFSFSLMPWVLVMTGTTFWKLVSYFLFIEWGHVVLSNPWSGWLAIFSVELVLLITCSSPWGGDQWQGITSWTAHVGSTDNRGWLELGLMRPRSWTRSWGPGSRATSKRPPFTG